MSAPCWTSVDGVLLTGARANVHPTRFGTRAASGARALRRAARRRGADAGRGLRAARRAGVRHLPRLPGDERGVRRLAASRDPRVAGAHEPPHAAAGDGRDPSRSARWFSPTGTMSASCPAAPSRRCSEPRSIRVNSLHGQGILEPGKRVVVEGIAEDGTIEAIRIAEAPGLRARRAMACRVRSAAQPDQPGPVPGVRRGAGAAEIAEAAARRPIRLATAGPLARG